MVRRGSDLTPANVTDAFVPELERILAGKVPADTIPARVAAFRDWKEIQIGIDAKMRRLRYALGEMDLQEVQRLTYGENPLIPSAESRLGKCIAETGAQTVIKQFPQYPYQTIDNGAGLLDQMVETGPQTLVVAVSPASFAAYQKYFSGVEYLIHIHTPGQGTLMMGHRGNAFQYHGSSDSMRAPGAGTILPHLLLSTSEGQRVAQYAELMKRSSGVAERPWTIPGYCPTGGYGSCTHWVGHIPIGDLWADH